MDAPVVFPPSRSAAAAALLLTLGCASTPEVDPAEVVAAEYARAPAWVVAGCGEALADASLLCGVGSAAGAAEAARLRDTAEGRARAALARTLLRRLQSALSDGAPAPGERPGPAADRERRRMELSKQITERSLAAAEVREHWTSPRGSVYVLAVLALDRFTDTVGGMETLPEEAREAVLERSSELFGADGLQRDAKRAPPLQPEGR